MSVKYTTGLALLLTVHAVMAQEVMYERVHAYTHRGRKKQKKIIKTVSMAKRKADLIYSPTCLLFKSPEGIDTVFLSSIQTTSRNFPYGKMFYISYNNRSDFITLLFCENEKEDARNFKEFMLKNGRYKRNFASALLYAPLSLSWSLELLLDRRPFPSLTQEAKQGCK